MFLRTEALLKDTHSGNSNKRYTPLLAYIMLPNIFLFYEFGKFILLFADILVGMLILNLSKGSNSIKIKQLSLWLFNPLTFLLSSRGSSDVIVTLLLFLTFYYFQKKQYNHLLYNKSDWTSQHFYLDSQCISKYIRLSLQCSFIQILRLEKDS